MKIPTKIKIGGHIFDIYKEDRSKNGIDGKLGSCNAARNTIWLDTNQPQTQLENTLLHEIIEAINWQQQLELDHKTISQLENALYQVLHDNEILEGKAEKRSKILRSKAP